jgi:surface antigen
MELDDTILVAYVDGELDSEMSREVEDRLQVDAAARERVKMFRESAAILRSAFNAVVHEPVPTRLVDKLVAAGKSDSRNDRPAASASASRWSPWMSVAASIVALLVGFGGGSYLAAYRADSSAEHAQALQERVAAARNSAIAHALNKSMSGTAVKWQLPDASEQGEIVPIRTYRNREGQYCREFRDAVTANGTARTAYEVRCRQADGVWAPEFRLIPLGPNRLDKS